MKTMRTQFSVLCPYPKCKTPFHFAEITFKGGVNDNGGWVVECAKCKKLFKVKVANPGESGTRLDWQIHKKFDGWPLIDNLGEATERLQHDIPRKRTAWTFNPATIPLFCCSQNGNPLDLAAHEELKTHQKKLQYSWKSAESILLAGRHPNSAQIMACLPVECTCGKPHTATFYAYTNLGASEVPFFERCLLAHIQNTNLERQLTRLITKSDFMDLLEKLLIRWHLTADHILVAAPFVGHQHMEDEDLANVWDWVFTNLDPNKGTLLTRSATWTSFKSLPGDGSADFKTLKKFGLIEQVVEKGAKKQDFHAKFFAGISAKKTEVLSGSANLLRGPSIENISFHEMSLERFKSQYLSILKFDPAPIVKPNRLPSALIFKEHKWTHMDLTEAPWA